MHGATEDLGAGTGQARGLVRDTIGVARVTAFGTGLVAPLPRTGAASASPWPGRYRSGWAAVRASRSGVTPRPTTPVAVDH